MTAPRNQSQPSCAGGHRRDWTRLGSPWRCITHRVTTIWQTGFCEVTPRNLVLEGRFLMQAIVFIEPHERFEAVEAYRQRLTKAQIDEVRDAPEGAIVQLNFGVGIEGTRVIIIEEG